MSAADRHPDLLAYVAGLLPAEERREIAAHLSRCDACRDEERALHSLRRSLLSETAAGHASPEDLVAHEAGTPRDSLVGHLARCAECRADLEALARVRKGGHVVDFGKSASPGLEFQEEDEAPFRPRGVRRVARKVLAAGLAASLAGVASLVAFGWLMFRPQTPARPSRPRPDLLYPATRGGTAPPAIAAARPAVLRVVLPFGAPGGRYETRLQNASGLEIVAQTSIVKDGEILEVRFDAPDRLGEYSLAVRSLETANAAPTFYPLRVVAGAPTPPR